MAKVNAVSSSDSANVQVKSKLSNDVAKQLEDLGIDSSKVKSDAEGKKLINEALKNKEVSQTDNAAVNYVTSDSESLILRDAKLLAKKMNIEVRPEWSLDDLLTRINTNIKKQKSLINTDKEKGIVLHKYSLVYTTLKTRQDTLLLKESGLVNSMDNNSLSNKKFLNL